MTLAFLAPLFFAGMAALIAPIIIHQIRRPEREPVRFSSLMFIPKVDKQVIERRRLQHLLLLLLRMTLFALIVFTFARPYLRRPEGPPVPSSAPARHLIVIDRSYSMGRMGALDEAKARAREILSRLSPSERVGVIAFGASPQVVAALQSDDDANAGTAQKASSAIDAVAISESTTAFVPALQRAQEMLLPGELKPGEETPPLHIHLISDFQRAGMPPRGNSWRLSPRIELDPIVIGSDEPANYSISDLSLRPGTQGEFRVLTKIKSWGSAREKSIEARVIVDGKEMATNPVAVKPGNASQTSFSFPFNNTDPVTGWVEIAADGLVIDNRRYFAWNPPKPLRLLLAAEEKPQERWPGAIFVERALQISPDRPRLVERIRPEEIALKLNDGTPRDVIVACDLTGMPEATGNALQGYIQRGGTLLLMMGPAMQPEPATAAFLAHLGIADEGPRRPALNESRFDLISWVDLTHPVFVQFQGARFNDFSQIHLLNSHVLRILDPSSREVRVLARSEEDEKEAARPLMIETASGSGKAIVWAFGADLEWSNFAKSVKFVPILHETVSYLAGGETARPDWQVGERYAGFPKAATESERFLVEWPGRQAVEVAAADLAARAQSPLDRSGLLKWKPVGSQAWSQIDAVNIDPAEADPARIGPEEFKLKLAAALPVEVAAVHADLDRLGIPAGFTLQREFWRPLLALMLILSLIEMWYAARLVR